MTKNLFSLFLFLFVSIFTKNCQSLVCSYCNGCSSSDYDNSQTCTEPYSSCFVGKRNGLIYQGCTTSNYMSLSSQYSNVEVCSMNYCNKYTQSNNRYSITCFYCLGCTNNNANKNTQICPDYSNSCFSGSISGMIYQGCTTSTQSVLSQTYSNLQLCTNNYCNTYKSYNYMGVQCYSCEGCSLQFSNNNIQQTCPDTSYSCYIGTANGFVYQGCTKETFSSLSSRFKNVQLCTSNLCNSNKLISIGLTCYSCQGCMSNNANLRTENCPDTSFRCYSGTKLGFLYQGCTQWSDPVLYNSYSSLKVCNMNFCNSYFINYSFKLESSKFLFWLAFLTPAVFSYFF